MKDPIKQQAEPLKPEIEAALKSLGLNCPYYEANRLPDGRIEIITRAGRHVWPKRRRRKRKAKTTALAPVTDSS